VFIAKAMNLSTVKDEEGEKLSRLPIDVIHIDYSGLNL
jgi:hypothetical protein